jgi:hypothetical protein
VSEDSKVAIDICRVGKIPTTNFSIAWRRREVTRGVTIHPLIFRCPEWSEEEA